MLSTHVYFIDESEIPTEEEWKIMECEKVAQYLYKHWDECIDEKRYIDYEGHHARLTYINL